MDSFASWLRDQRISNRCGKIFTHLLRATATEPRYCALKARCSDVILLCCSRCVSVVLSIFKREYIEYLFDCVPEEAHPWPNTFPLTVLSAESCMAVCFRQFLSKDNHQKLQIKIAGNDLHEISGGWICGWPFWLRTSSWSSAQSYSLQCVRASICDAAPSVSAIFK